jgi:hypothetical protein
MQQVKTFSKRSSAARNKARMINKAKAKAAALGAPVTVDTTPIIVSKKNTNQSRNPSSKEKTKNFN